MYAPLRLRFGIQHWAGILTVHPSVNGIKIYHCRAKTLNFLNGESDILFLCLVFDTYLKEI